MRGAERFSFCTLMFHHLLEDKWQYQAVTLCCAAVSLAQGGKASRGETTHAEIFCLPAKLTPVLSPKGVTLQFHHDQVLLKPSFSHTQCSYNFRVRGTSEASSQQVAELS